MKAWNLEQLATLGKNAVAFAKCYTALVEALMAEGVPEAKAREDARWVAFVAAVAKVDDPRPEPWDD